jgi:hypothetical protein
MMEAPVSQPETRLNEFEQKVRRAVESLERDAVPPEDSTANAEGDERMKLLLARIQAKIETSHGVDWELLYLEFQRDLMILAAEFGRWGRYLDKTFARQETPPHAQGHSTPQS